jgi:siroheme decarboxylase
VISPSTDQIDLILLNALQEDIPLVPRPWDNIGEEIGITGEEVLARLNRMANIGILRGIAPTLESAKRKAGVSTLIATQVPEEKITDIAALVNGYPEVSHNFRRKNEYNLWFTLAAESEARIDEIISDILNRTGIQLDATLNLKTVRRYKIDVKFPLLQTPDGGRDGSC